MQAAEFDDYSMSENLFVYSEQYNQSNWIKTSSTITTNAITAPDGLSTAEKLIGNNGVTGRQSVYQDISCTSGVTYTFSVFLKQAERRYITIWFDTPNITEGAFYGASTYIDLQTGTIATGTQSKIVAYPNGWYRCYVTATPNFTGSLRLNTSIGTPNNAGDTGAPAIYKYTGDGVSGIYIWGSQVETGTNRTDYTPTTTTAVNRVLSSTTNTNITGFSTYYSSGFDENVGFTTFLPANISAPYDPVYDEFGGTFFGAGQGRYMRQYTDKSVIVYNEIDEVTDFRDIVRTGLVLDLDAAQPLSYKGTGTSWNDLSGTGNNGTLVNTPTYDTSGYFNFDYTQSESVSFSSSSSIQFLNRSAYTLEAWVYPTRNPGAANYTGIFDREDTSTGSRDGYNIFFLGSATTDTYFYTERFVAGVNGFTFITLNQSVSVNNWSHIVATYDGTTLTLYRNGSSVGTPATTTGNITNTSKTLTVGVRGGNYFGGRIANAKIYNRALTASEIQQNYNALKHRFGL